MNVPNALYFYWRRVLFARIYNAEHTDTKTVTTVEGQYRHYTRIGGRGWRAASEYPMGGLVHLLLFLIPFASSKQENLVGAQEILVGFPVAQRHVPEISIVTRDETAS